MIKYIGTLFILTCIIILSLGYYIPNKVDKDNNIDFGDSQSKVRKLMTACKLVDLPGHLSYQGSLYGYTQYNIDFKFINNKLVSIVGIGTPFDYEEYDVSLNALMDNMLRGYGAYQDSTDGKVTWTTKKDSLIVMYNRKKLLIKFITIPRIHAGKLY